MWVISREASLSQFVLGQPGDRKEICLQTLSNLLSLVGQNLSYGLYLPCTSGVCYLLPLGSHWETQSFHESSLVEQEMSPGDVGVHGLVPTHSHLQMSPFPPSPTLPRVAASSKGFKTMGKAQRSQGQLYWESGVTC